MFTLNFAISKISPPSFSRVNETSPLYMKNNLQSSSPLLNIISPGPYIISLSFKERELKKSYEKFIVNIGVFSRIFPKYSCYTSSLKFLAMLFKISCPFRGPSPYLAWV